MKDREKKKSFVRDDRKRFETKKKTAYLAGIALIAVLGILDRKEEWKKWQKEEKECQQM